MTINIPVALQAMSAELQDVRESVACGVEYEVMPIGTLRKVDRVLAVLRKVQAAMTPEADTHRTDHPAWVTSVGDEARYD